MKIRTVVVVVTVGALVTLGLFVRNELRAVSRGVQERRAAAAMQAHSQAERYADAVAAEPRPPSDARLAELGSPLGISVIAVERAPRLSVEIASRMVFDAGYAGASFAEACYMVTVDALIRLPACPGITPPGVPPPSR